MKQFYEIKVGKVFTKNRNTYLKQSSRTAKIISSTGKGKIFYFGQKETVRVR